MSFVRILLVGAGAREDAMAWKLNGSNDTDTVFISTGGKTTPRHGVEIQIPHTDPQALLEFAINNRVGYTVVGSEDSLALGIVDLFEKHGQLILGPTQQASILETSKSEAHQVLTTAGVDTPRTQYFTDLKEASTYLLNQSLPIVIKDDGLAGGKGVWICDSMVDAYNAIARILISSHRKNPRVVIQEYIAGQEVSSHMLCAKRSADIWPVSQDHKRIGEGDTGENTGGMGAIAPVPWFNSSLSEPLEYDILYPIFNEMGIRNIFFEGFLFPGLMVTSNNRMVVLECNARPGDPEMQVYMRLLESDFLDLVGTAISGEFNSSTRAKWREGYAATITLASSGYPGKYSIGHHITGIEEAEKVPGVVVFHAGVKVENGRFYTAGGRVLSISAIGSTLKEALERAYLGVSCIHFEGMYFRRDIGLSSPSLFQ